MPFIAISAAQIYDEIFRHRSIQSLPDCLNPRFDDDGLIGIG